MGERTYMIATPPAERQKLIDCLGLIQAQESEVPSATWCGLMVPNGWFVMSTAWDDARDAAIHRQLLSCRVDAVVVGRESHVMYSESRRFLDGEERWSIRTGGDFLPRDEVVVDGDPPQAFDSIYREFQAKQTESNRERHPVDWLYEVPEQTAKTLTGYELEDEYSQDFPQELYSYYRAVRKGWLRRLLART
ncbi:MAG: hypothetical protein AAGK09_08890 [Planctomycetota bacterium]